MTKLLLRILCVYQKFSAGLRLAGGLPFFTMTTCKFHPSCSEYAILAIRGQGALVGSVKTVGRVCRCHPWSSGGVDYPF